MRYYEDDIDDLADRFLWESDGKFDSYRILDAAVGPLKGDCDDFAVTALWITEGRSMLRFWWALISCRAVIWYVKGTGFASHVVLWHRKHGWIDNQNPTWGANRDKLRFPLPFPLVALKMLLGRI
jgi:hypothetical protein